MTKSVTRIAEYSAEYGAAARGDRVRIGRYELIAKVGNGGMAEAHLALAGDLPGLRTLVVVKRILPHLSSNESFVRMFHDEARIGALLDHPNIARLIEVGCDEDGYFLVMEPVQGKPLSAFLRQAHRHENPVPHGMAAFIVAQAANGLGYAHGLSHAGRPLNLVHRDVSPENVLVSFEGAIKVIDFGIASALGRLTETRPGGHKGKVEYMSPEQAMGRGVDQRSDIFALGIVLWEAVCGRRLFRRPTDLATVRALVDEPIPRPSGVVAISPRLERIIMRALERDPARRFQDAQEMSLLLLRHALATDGFSPGQVGERMRKLFASDYATWRATVETAVDIEGRRPPRIATRFARGREPVDETGGPTVRLYALPGPSSPSAVAEEAAPVGEASPSSVGAGEEGTRRSGPGLSARLLFVGLICGASLLHPEATRMVGRPASSHEGASFLGAAPIPPGRTTSTPPSLPAGCGVPDTLVCAGTGRASSGAAATSAEWSSRSQGRGVAAGGAGVDRTRKRLRRKASDASKRAVPARLLSRAQAARPAAPAADPDVWRDPFE
ncbi:MAG TPA: serine/threonine-protein kinase [Polyangia bacterium]|nr:serine/threonine-protein kinase [Polyangia bacterium]